MLICPKCHSTNYDGKYCSNCGYGKFIRQPQTVEITWYPYPENKPKKDLEKYIVERDNGGLDGVKSWTTTAIWFGKWVIEDEITRAFMSIEKYPIIAFSELPQGYKENQ